MFQVDPIIVERLCSSTSHMILRSFQVLQLKFGNYISRFNRGDVSTVIVLVDNVDRPRVLRDRIIISLRTRARTGENE